MEPVSLYWYARSSAGLPLLQYLAFYQIIEFYFPIFSKKEAHNKIKHTIKDPRFNADRDADISRILSIVIPNNGNRGFGSEKEQMIDTIKHCISAEELREFMESKDERITYFKSKGSKKLTNKNLALETKNNDLISQVAYRIYDIRCRIVHTKAAGDSLNLLLPSSPEVRDMKFDIELVEYIATKVLIATSSALKINII